MCELRILNKITGTEKKLSYTQTHRAKIIYSQTRSSVPVANELMNLFTEKCFRLLIQ